MNVVALPIIAGYLVIGIACGGRLAACFEHRQGDRDDPATVALYVTVWPIFVVFAGLYGAWWLMGWLSIKARDHW